MRGKYIRVLEPEKVCVCDRCNTKVADHRDFNGYVWVRHDHVSFAGFFLSYKDGCNYSETYSAYHPYIDYSFIACKSCGRRIGYRLQDRYFKDEKAPPWWEKGIFMLNSAKVDVSTKTDHGGVRINDDAAAEEVDNEVGPATNGADGGELDSEVGPSSDGADGGELDNEGGPSTNGADGGELYNEGGPSSDGADGGELD